MAPPGSGRRVQSLEQWLPLALAGAFVKTGRATLPYLAQVLAEHPRDDFQLCDLDHRPLVDRAPVAHDRDAVADLVKLVEPVGDVDHADAPGFEPADDPEQGLDFPAVQR